MKQKKSKTSNQNLPSQYQVDKVEWFPSGIFLFKTNSDFFVLSTIIDVPNNYRNGCTRFYPAVESSGVVQIVKD